MNPSGSEPLRNLDLVKWLDNKLGDSNELWSGRQASSLLTKEMLVELESCFEALEPHVKLKIIQAIPHLSPKMVELWKVPLQRLLDLGRTDADDWVHTISDMYRDFPESGCIRNVPTNEDSQLYTTLTSLQETVKTRIDDNALKFLPPDMTVCSHSAIRAKYGFAEVELRKDFNLKGKPKSYLLKVDLIKAAENQNNPANKKSNGLITSFPIKMRSTAKKLNNDLPMKSITTTSNTLKLSTGFTNEPKKFQRALPKREGGAKMIDISEIPQPLKRRRGTVEIIEPKPLKPTKDEKKSMVKTPSPKKDLGKTNVVEILSAPALVSGFGDKQKSEMKEDDGLYQPLTRPGGRLARSETMDSEVSSNSMKSVGQTSSTLSITRIKQEFTKFVAQTSTNPQDRLAGTKISAQQLHSPPIQSPEVKTSLLFQEVRAPQPQHQAQIQQPQPIQPPQQIQFNLYQSQPMHIQPQQQQPQQQPQSIQPIQHTLYMPQQSLQQQQMQQQQQQQQMDPQAAYQAQLQQAVRQQCQELCKNANRLTPAGYNLILSFMSGNKDHPFAGNDIVTLQLSENIEDESLANGIIVKALVETYFQMDYRTGEWKRLRKSRLLKPEELGKYGVQSPQQTFSGSPVMQNQVGTSQNTAQQMNFSMNFG